MKKHLRQRGIRLLLATTLLLALAAGIAYAQIPDSNGLVHACYAKSGGALRVIDGSVTNCSSKETSLNWNQKGVTGAKGATGTAGTNGINGAKGATGTNGTNGINGAKGATGTAGTNGINGAKGATGTAGTNGINGAKGATGTNGTNGINGAKGATGTNGTNGINGPKGATGPTGSSGILDTYQNGVFAQVPSSAGTTGTHVRASCDPGDLLLGGGFDGAGVSGDPWPNNHIEVIGSQRVLSESGPEWFVAFYNPTPYVFSAVAWAECLDLPPAH